MQHEAQNAMSISNLAIVFGPTLFGQGSQPMDQANSMADAAFHNKVGISRMSMFAEKS